MRWITTFVQGNVYKSAMDIVLALYAFTLTTHAHAGKYWRQGLDFPISPDQFKITEGWLVYALCADLAIRLGVRLLSGTWPNGWWWFDFFTTGLAFIPGLEATRAIRLYRALDRWPFFRDTVEDIGAAVRSTLPLLVIFAMSVYIKGLIGYFAFAESMPDHFGDLGMAMMMSLVLVLMEVETFREMYSHAPGITWIYAVLNFGSGVIAIALMFAKSSDASHENDDHSK